MLTFDLPIETVLDAPRLSEYVWQGTGLHHKLYNNFDLHRDENYVKELLGEFPLYDKSMYGDSVDEIKGEKKGRDARIEADKEKVARIEYLLKTGEFNTKKEKHEKHKLHKKLERLQKRLKENKDSTFGGKALQRRITTAAQNIQAPFPTEEEMLEIQKENPSYTYADYEEYVLQQMSMYLDYRDEFRDNRKHGIYLIGRACEGGSRKIDFDLRNNWVVFKPNAKTQIVITFRADKNQAKILWKLQKMADAEIMPITVRITESRIYFMYDEQMLAGYHFDEAGKNRYIKENNIESDEGKSKVWKMFKDKQRVNQLFGKKKNRFAAVDLNPYEIGLVIGDQLSNDPMGDFKVVFKCCFKFPKLHKKLGLASDHPSQVHQNNKRNHEIREIWKRIFNILEYFHVAYFTNEELKFKINKSDYGAEFNRLTKNVWHRTLTMNLITKYCNILGIQRREVNSVYSSFIGNMNYGDYDCIAAATELLRRGITKFISGSSLYPPVSETCRQKLFYLLGENTDVKGLKWNKIYKLFPPGLRYRNKVTKPYQDRFMASHHSGVHVLTNRRVVDVAC